MSKAIKFPEGMIEKAEKLISQADQMARYTGAQKRKFVAKQLAKWIDDKIKLPWYLELIDGPLMSLVFEWLIQVIFDIVQRHKEQKVAIAAEAEKLRIESDELKRKKRGE